MSHQPPPVVHLIVAIVIIVKGIGKGGIDLAVSCWRGGSGVEGGRWGVGDGTEAALSVDGSIDVVFVVSVNLYIVRTSTLSKTLKHRGRDAYSFVSCRHDDCRRVSAASRVRSPLTKEVTHATSSTRYRSDVEVSGEEEKNKQKERFAICKRKRRQNKKGGSFFQGNDVERFGCVALQLRPAVTKARRKRARVSGGGLDQ